MLVVYLPGEVLLYVIVHTEMATCRSQGLSIMIAGGKCYRKVRNGEKLTNFASKC